MGDERRRGAIFLKVFGRVSLRIGKLRNFELFSVGKEHRWSDNAVGISF